MQMSMTVCDIYCRVSTERQADKGYSLEEQESLLRKYAESQNWVINKVYVDGGYTGKNMDRPGLQALIKDVEERKINKVLVYKLDRLSRSQKETLYLIEDVFIKNGVDFVSATQAFDTSNPLGRAMLGILSTFAQLERETITERMMLGKDARVKNGYFKAGANVPIGYVYNPVDKSLTQNEFEAAMIRNVFDWYHSGETMNGIAKKLNLTYAFRRNNWSAGHISRILKNPIYSGLQRWKGEEYRVKNCEQIIDNDLFEAVQADMARRCEGMKEEQGKRQTAYKHVTLLGGMIFCGKCGRRYTGIRDRTYAGKFIPRYYCVNRLSAGRIRGVKCLNKGYRCDVLDGIIISQIERLAADRSLVTARIAKDNTADEIRGILKRIESIKAQQGKLIELYTIGAIDADMISDRSESLAKEKESLQNRIIELEDKEKQRLSIAKVNNTLDTFTDVIAAAKNDVMLLYPIVHELIKSITIDDEEITIEWAFESN